MNETNFFIVNSFSSLDYSLTGRSKEGDFLSKGEMDTYFFDSFYGVVPVLNFLMRKLLIYDLTTFFSFYWINSSVPLLSMMEMAWINIITSLILSSMVTPILNVSAEMTINGSFETLY